MTDLRYAALILPLLALANSSFGESSIENLIERAGLAEGPVAVRDLQHYVPPRKILLANIGIDLETLSAEHPDIEFIEVTSSADARRHAAAADAIVGYCDQALVDAAERLVWVQIYTAGVERCLSTEQIANGRVLLTNMQKMSSPVIAEHAIAMVLALSRKLPQFAKGMPSGEWRRNNQARAGMVPVSGRTLLVAGLGGIGTEVARLGAALDMRVIGIRNSSREGPEFVSYVGLSSELNDLVAEADVIVNALPLTDATEGLFDADVFAAMKPGAILVNVGRGKTVDTPALVAALESGQLAGAGLDVTDPEPLPKRHPLWQFSNVIITPHIASSGGERERHRLLLAENLRRYIAGESLLNVVDPQRGY